MAEAAHHARVKISRATSTTFKVLFALAAVIAAGATYMSVTDNSPQGAGRPALLWLLGANLVLITGIASVLGLRVHQLLKENRETGGGARLRLRIIFLFSLAAAIPTLIVAIFLAVIINRSIESWFSGPMNQIVVSGREAAAAAKNDFGQAATADFAAMLADFDACDDCRTSQTKFEQLAQGSAALRKFPRVSLLNESGERLLEVAGEGAPPFVAPQAGSWDKARAGGIGPYIDFNAYWALARLPNYGGSTAAYLYVARPFSVDLADRLKRADNNLIWLEQAETRRRQLQTVLTLSYLETALLMLLGTAWLGMTAAARIAMPIGGLASAARAVRDGDPNVRIERPPVRDEIDDLAVAFNEMLERLARQTTALDKARIEAEMRTAFTEAVLAGVEAGVVRVNQKLKVTVANASAQSMLGFVMRPLVEPSLDSVAPESVAATRRAIESEQSVEATFRRSSEFGVRHFHVRVAPESDGTGAVITYHDATRLVNRQREAAWRDVARRIAHEIRNPLTPIQLSAERLRRRFSSQVTQDRETFERCTETILRQVGDIGRMVEEFTVFARMPRPTFGDFSFTDMAQNVAFSQRMANPSVSIQVNAPSQLVRATGDERMLAQALTNVVKNAAEAVERQIETGAIKTGAVTVDIQVEGEDIHVIVRDNGPGFPAHDRDRLLEPYVTTRKNGVGLGLAIVSRIVEDHGGRVWLGNNDQAVNGARVDIRVPMRPPVSEESVAFQGEGAA